MMGTPKKSGWVLFKTDEERERELIDHFFKSLNATYTKNKSESDGSDNLGDVKKQIGDLFAEERSWENAYEIEQLMVPILSEECLDLEIGRNLVETKTRLSQGKQEYYQEQVTKATVMAQKQALLGGMIADVQWRKQIRQLHRKYSRLTRVRTGTMFGISVVLLFIPVFYTDFGTKWIALNTALIAVAAGFMGASFSMLLSLKERIESATLEDMKIQRRWTFMFSRAMIGLGAAFIFYFFLRGEIVGGTFFPDFSSADLEKPLPLAWKQLALLVVWSFIAGFSEKLVPNLISDAEQKISVKSS